MLVETCRFVICVQLAHVYLMNGGIQFKLKVPWYHRNRFVGDFCDKFFALFVEYYSRLSYNQKSQYND